MSKVDERIAQRRREVRDATRRRRLRRTITVVVSLVLLVVAFLVERSSLVALDEVEVTGTVRLDAEVVRDAADLPLGTSTLRLRLGAAERRVEELALVGDADISRVDPLTVRISVTERQPVLVAMGGGRQALVSEDGVVIAPGSEPGLPVVELLAGGIPAVGELVDASPPLDAAFTIHHGLSGPLRTEVVRYVARADDDVDAVLTSGITVRLGNAERLDEQSRALGAVLEDLGGATVSTVDVRAPRAPVVRP